MDSLDKITTAPNKPLQTARDDARETAIDGLEDTLSDTADIVTQEAEKVARKVNWWAVAGYSAAAVAVVSVGYAYWRGQQKKPQTRLEKLRDQLGLSEVDFKHLRSTYRNIDFDKLNDSRRRVVEKARQATHNGAKRVAELTR